MLCKDPLLLLDPRARAAHLHAIVLLGDTAAQTQTLGELLYLVGQAHGLVPPEPLETLGHVVGMLLEISGERTSYDSKAEMHAPEGTWFFLTLTQ